MQSTIFNFGKGSATMVVPLSFSGVVNMRFICEVLIVLLSMITLQPSIASRMHRGDHIKSAIYYSPKMEMGPGTVARTDFLDIDFPRGHIGIKGFDAELVDEDKNPIPLYDTYLHHWFAIKYHQNSTGGQEFRRNDGACNGNVLPHHWGLGGDSRRTNSRLPDPFAVEVGNPAHIAQGSTEKWLFNILAIDTRGVRDRKACTECRCDAFGVPEQFLAGQMGLEGKNLTREYTGGLFCCQPQFPCKLEQGNSHQNRSVMLKYKIKWVAWDENKVPLRFYILDVADRVTYNASHQPVHQCLIEYNIPEKVEGQGPYDIRRAKIPMEHGGFLIYGTAHVHTGVVKGTLFGEDGRVLCAVKPIYGKGEEPGNEKGYAVGMSTCHPQPGSVKIKKNETVTAEFVYESGYRTGAMGQFYIHLADSIPYAY